MIWSKKIRLFRDRLAESLRGRLEIQTAAYRQAYEERGRTWITFAREEVLSFCDFVHENEWRKHHDLAAVAKAGIYSRQDFGSAFGRYLQLDIDDALASGDPLILALAVVDRRVGKRRLRLLAENHPAEPAQTLLRLRMQAEGIVPEKLAA